MADEGGGGGGGGVGGGGAEGESSNPCPSARDQLELPGIYTLKQQPFPHFFSDTYR